MPFAKLAPIRPTSSSDRFDVHCSGIVSVSEFWAAYGLGEMDSKAVFSKYDTGLQLVCLAVYKRRYTQVLSCKLHFCRLSMKNALFEQHCDSVMCARVVEIFIILHT